MFRIIYLTENKHSRLTHRLDSPRMWKTFRFLSSRRAKMSVGQLDGVFQPSPNMPCTLVEYPWAAAALRVRYLPTVATVRRYSKYETGDNTKTNRRWLLRSNSHQTSLANIKLSFRPRNRRKFRSVVDKTRQFVSRYRRFFW
jgi:hypothetical protein